jgi:hypothetical protein
MKKLNKTNSHDIYKLKYDTFYVTERVVVYHISDIYKLVHLEHSYKYIFVLIYSSHFISSSVLYKYLVCDHNGRVKAHFQKEMGE